MTRRRGRSARVRDRAEKSALPPRMPALARRLIPQEVLDAEGLERIHEASMQILEEVGIAFRDETALADWRRLGARVEGELVFPGRDLVMELVGRAPGEFDLGSRNPERVVAMGGRNTVFSPMQGAPYVRDLDGVRRQSTLDDLDTFSKLTQMAPCFHVAGGFTCEANDQPVPWRHLLFNASNLLYTDLPYFGATTSRERAEDSVAMARIVHGDEVMDRGAVLIGHISGNSPRLWDETMLEAARVYARNGQAVLMSPIVLASANTPADVAAPVDLVVIDVSFISLTKILPVAFSVLAADGDLICLVKPQFELAREEVGKGGKHSGLFIEVAHEEETDPKATVLDRADTDEESAGAGASGKTGGFSIEKGPAGRIVRGDLIA